MKSGINRKPRQKAHQVQGDSRRKNWRYFKAQESKWKAGNESWRCFDSQAAVTIAGTEKGSKAWPIITISFSTFTIPGLLPFTFCKYLGFVYDTSTFPLARALEHIPQSKPNQKPITTSIQHASQHPNLGKHVRLLNFGNGIQILKDFGAAKVVDKPNLGKVCC